MRESDSPERRAPKSHRGWVMILIQVIGAVLLGAFAGLVLVVVVGGILALLFWMDRRSLEAYSAKHPPYCSIDPQCHPGFAWHEGRGFIAGNEVQVRN